MRIKWSGLFGTSEYESTPRPAPVAWPWPSDGTVKYDADALQAENARLRDALVDIFAEAHLHGTDWCTDRAATALNPGEKPTWRCAACDSDVPHIVTPEAHERECEGDRL